MITTGTGGEIYAEAINFVSTCTPQSINVTRGKIYAEAINFVSTVNRQQVSSRVINYPSDSESPLEVDYGVT